MMDFDIWHSISREVLKQGQVLRNDMREPGEIRIGKEQVAALNQETTFLVSATDEGWVGWMHGLQIYIDDEPGMRVLPKDWNGYGQGVTR